VDRPELARPYPPQRGRLAVSTLLVMAGTGRPPKGIGNRRRYGSPVRGEWVDLEAEVTEPVLPPFHPEMTVPQWLWEAWMWSPVTLLYGRDDIAYICELGHRYALMKDAEQRVRMDALGLTPKGKRDLRLRTPLDREMQEKAVALNADIRRRLRVTASKEDVA
jgi:hypothetical protein